MGGGGGFQAHLPQEDRSRKQRLRWARPKPQKLHLQIIAAAVRDLVNHYSEKSPLYEEDLTWLGITGKLKGTKDKKISYKLVCCERDIRELSNHVQQSEANWSDTLSGRQVQSR